jgi:hypothetical protein
MLLYQYEMKNTFASSLSIGYIISLFTVLRPAQEFFSYKETTPKFRPMLGAQGF